MPALRKHLVIVAVLAAAIVLGGAAVVLAFGSRPAAVPPATTTPYPIQPVRPSCPARDSQPVLSTRAGAGAEIVPPGAEQLLLCRYNGLPNPPPLSVPGKPAFGLVAQHLITAEGTVAGIASQLDAIPETTGAYNCPADFGTAIVAFFEYPSGPANPVKVGLGGCEAVTNGQMNRLALGAPVVARLAALVPVTPLRSARINGYIWLCGGPAPGRCRIESITVCGPTPAQCVRADRVTVSDLSGRLVATAKLRRSRFAVSVVPGRYRVRLLGDGPRVHGRVFQTRAVTARAGRTSTVRFLIAIP